MNEILIQLPQMKVILVTPEMAKKWLGNSRRNRSISLMIVHRYSCSMKAGTWQLTPSGILLGPNEELLDGQHRLSAIVESNIPVLMTVFFNVNPSVVDVIDIGRKRTSTHVAERLDLKNASLLVTSLHDVGEIMFGGTTKRQLPNDYLSQVLPAWDKELQPHILQVKSYCKFSGTNVKSIYIALHYFCTVMYGEVKTKQVFERLLAAINLNRGVKEATIRRDVILAGYQPGTKDALNVGETMFMLKRILPLFNRNSTVEAETVAFKAQISENTVALMNEGFALSSSVYNAIRVRKPKK